MPNFSAFLVPGRCWVYPSLTSTAVTCWIMSIRLCRWCCLTVATPLGLGRHTLSSMTIRPQRNTFWTSSSMASQRSCQTYRKWFIAKTFIPWLLFRPSGRMLAHRQVLGMVYCYHEEHCSMSTAHDYCSTVSLVWTAPSDSDCFLSI
jgi:hypothetical protein